MKKVLSIMFAILLIVSMSLTTLAATTGSFAYTDDDLLVVKQTFESAYSNQIIALPSWKVSVPNIATKVSAKVDLTTFNYSQLRFYNYSKTDNKLTAILEPQATLSDDSILTFSTDSNQGFIIITDSDFTLKTTTIAPTPVKKVVSTVYWVPNGIAYHSTDQCATLSRSSDIRSGTIPQAKNRTACKVCH